MDMVQGKNDCKHYGKKEFPPKECECFDCEDVISCGDVAFAQVSKKKKVI